MAALFAVLAGFLATTLLARALTAALLLATLAGFRILLVLLTRLLIFTARRLICHCHTPWVITPLQVR
jgi:hypothetical protein